MPITANLPECLLQNDIWNIAVVPAAGCKIRSLRSVRSSREWLWRNPHLPLVRPEYGCSYVEHFDTGGWDEIFPSVSPDHAGRLNIPDHGDLVGLQWEVLEHSDTRLLASVQTRFAACRFTRDLQLHGRSLRLGYEVANHGSQPVPYLWCAHPLFDLEPGMRIVLPEGIALDIRNSIGLPKVNGFSWPGIAGLMRLDRIPDPSATGFQCHAVKMFTRSNAVGRVDLVAPNGDERLVFEWSPEEIPHLGLWLNCRAWSGCGSPPYFNLGIEPATAPFDCLTDAITAGCHRVLEPGTSVKWHLRVSGAGV